MRTKRLGTLLTATLAMGVLAALILAMQAQAGSLSTANHIALQATEEATSEATAEATAEPTESEATATEAETTPTVESAPTDAPTSAPATATPDAPNPTATPGNPETPSSSDLVGEAPLRLGVAGSDCAAEGQGSSDGSVEAEYHSASNSVDITLHLDGAPANARYLVEIAECNPQGGLWLARGTVGEVQTNGQGDAEFSTSWTLRSDARMLKLNLISICDGEPGRPPEIPCGNGSNSLSADAFVPHGR